MPFLKKIDHHGPGQSNLRRIFGKRVLLTPSLQNGFNNHELSWAECRCEKSLHTLRTFTFETTQRSHVSDPMIAALTTSATGIGSKICHEPRELFGDGPVRCCDKNPMFVPARVFMSKTKSNLQSRRFPGIGLPILRHAFEVGS